MSTWTKRMKKGFCFIVMLLALMIPATAQAASTKTKVNEAAKKVMTAVQKADIKALNTCMVNPNKDGAEQIKQFKNLLAYMKKYNKKMTWKITKTSVSGKKATVTLKVSYVNSKPYGEKAVVLMIQDVMNGKSQKEISSAAYLDKLIGRIMKTKYTLKKQTKTVKLNFQKTGTKWKLTKVTDALEDVIFANLNTAMTNAADRLS